MAQPQTMVRVYKSPEQYRKDAERLARDGWFPLNVTERRPRAGCFRLLFLWFIVLIFPPKPELVVTYHRSITTSPAPRKSREALVSQSEPRDEVLPSAIAPPFIPSFCKHCGAARRSGDRFCETCGYDYQSAVVTPINTASAASVSPKLSKPRGRAKTPWRWILVGVAVLIIAVAIIGSNDNGQQAGAPTETMVSRLIAVSPSVQQVDFKTITPTAVPTQSQAALPTNTPRPTISPQLTNTPQPTDTPRPINTPRPTDTPQPTPTVRVEPAYYEVAEDELQQVTRPRWVVSIVIPEGSEEQIISACAEVVQDYLDRGGADVALVFGYQSYEETENFFTRCRAQGTSDGQGYSGDGESIFGTEVDGRIQVEVGSAIEETKLVYISNE